MVAPQNKSNDGGRLITPADFCSTDQEKVKLNWFLFEYALECEAAIRRDKQLSHRLVGKGVDARAVASFCVHQSKLMRKEILDKLSGRIEAVNIGYEGIEAFFPKIGDELVDSLLRKVAEAWDSQTESCVTCPTRCISEKDERAPMFDDRSYWE